MRRYLKNFKFTEEFIEGAIYDCLNGSGNSQSRWKRMDTAYFLSDYLLYFLKCDSDDITRHNKAHEVHDLLCAKPENKLLMKPLIKCIARNLCHEINNREIELSPIRYQERYDSSSMKKRLIGLASIKQQIYDHVVVRACKEMFMNKIGQYQCASIPNRGQTYGKAAIETWIRTNPKQCKYVWKGDIRKFYPSIPHKKLKKLLRRDIKNDDVLYVVFYLIDTYSDDGKGLCIGSYLSQFLANYYLSYAYHYLSEQCFTVRKKRRSKEVVKVRLISHQIFYMDDICLFSPNKKHLKKCVLMLEKYLNEELELEIKEGHQLFPLDSRPIDMMGYKIYTYKTTIRRRIFKRANRILTKHRNPKVSISLNTARSLMSYKGYFDHTNSIKYKKKIKLERTIKNAKEVVKENANYRRIYEQTA